MTTPRLFLLSALFLIVPACGEIRLMPGMDASPPDAVPVAVDATVPDAAELMLDAAPVDANAVDAGQCWRDVITDLDQGEASFTDGYISGMPSSLVFTRDGLGLGDFRIDAGETLIINWDTAVVAVQLRMGSQSDGDGDGIRVLFLDDVWGNAQPLSPDGQVTLYPQYNVNQLRFRPSASDGFTLAGFSYRLAGCQ